MRIPHPARSPQSAHYCFLRNAIHKPCGFISSRYARYIFPPSLWSARASTASRIADMHLLHPAHYCILHNAIHKPCGFISSRYARYIFPPTLWSARASTASRIADMHYCILRNAIHKPCGFISSRYARYIFPPSLRSARASTASRIADGKLHCLKDTEYRHECAGCYGGSDNACYIGTHRMHQQEVCGICFRTDFL